MNIDLDRVPSSLDEAVEMMVSWFDLEDRQALIDSSPTISHHSLGRMIRNAWSLWDRETVLVRWFIDNLGIAHADDLSGTILSAVWARVRGEPFDAAEHAQRYREHWRKSGIDPVTLKSLEEQ